MRASDHDPTDASVYGARAHGAGGALDAVAGTDLTSGALAEIGACGGRLTAGELAALADGAGALLDAAAA